MLPDTAGGDVDVKCVAGQAAHDLVDVNVTELDDTHRVGWRPNNRDRPVRRAVEHMATLQHTRPDVVAEATDGVLDADVLTPSLSLDAVAVLKALAGGAQADVLVDQLIVSLDFEFLAGGLDDPADGGLADAVLGCDLTKVLGLFSEGGEDRLGTFDAGFLGHRIYSDH